MRRMITYCLVLALGGIVSVLVLTGCYNAHARSVLRDRLENAPREPGSNILRGAEPVTVDRGRPRACLLLHGFMSSPADFGELPEALDRAGWDVDAPLLPGHGRDPRELRNVTAEDLISFAEEKLEALSQRYDTVALGGFSMGGAMALILTDEMEPEATFLVNPYLRSTYHLRYVLPVRWWHAVLSPLLEYGVHGGRIPVNRPEGQESAVVYHVAPASIFAEVIKLSDMARASQHPNVPVLMAVSRSDDTASSRACRDFFEKTAGRHDEIKLFERSNHLLLLDYDRGAAIEAIVDFLEGGTE